MSLGKKILTIVLAVLLVAVIGVGIVFGLKGNKDNEPTDAEAKLAVTNTTQFLEETLGSLYKKSVESVSGSISGRLSSSENLISESSTDVSVRNYTLDRLLVDITAPTAMLSMVDFMMRNDQVSFDKQIYGTWGSSDEQVFYVHLVRQDDGFVLSINAAYRDENEEFNGEDQIIIVDAQYDYENEKPLNIKVINYYDDYAHSVFINVEESKLYSLLIDDSVLHTLHDSSKTITNDNIKDYYCYDMSACYAEVDYADFNLSHFDGFLLEGATKEDFVSENVNLSTLHKNIYREALQTFVNNFPTEESIKSSVDKDNSNISYLLEDAYKYAMSMTDFYQAKDANGNNYYFNRFEKLDVVKNHMSQIASVANNTKPLYGDINYTAEGFDGTKEISILSFKGVINSLTAYLNSKNDTSYAGVRDVVYGNYTFSLFLNDMIRYSDTTANNLSGEKGSDLLQNMIWDNEILSYNDKYLANVMYGIYDKPNSTDCKYIYLIYVVDANDNVIYINYRECEDSATDTTTVFEYLNTDNHSAILYASYKLTNFNVYSESKKYPVITADTFVKGIEHVMFGNGTFEFNDNFNNVYSEGKYKRGESTLNTMDVYSVSLDNTVVDYDQEYFEICQNGSYYEFTNLYFPFGETFEDIMDGFWY